MGSDGFVKGCREVSSPVEGALSGAPPAAMSSGATASGEPLPQPLSEDEKAKLQAEGIWPDDLVEAMDREPEILAEYRAASPEEAVELLRAHVMRLVYVGGDDADDDDNDAADESERVG